MKEPLGGRGFLQSFPFTNTLVIVYSHYTYTAPVDKLKMFYTISCLFNSSYMERYQSDPPWSCFVRTVMKRNCGSLLDLRRRSFILIARFNVLPIIPPRGHDGLGNALLSV